MKIAMPIWEGRVSPVMDTATCLLIVTLEGEREISNLNLPLPQSGIYQRARIMSNLGIDVLICGAITRPFENLLSGQGIRIHSWIKGEIAEVVAAFKDGSLSKNNFNLPGCGCRNRRMAGFGRRGHGRGHRRRNLKEDL